MVRLREQRHTQSRRRAENGREEGQLRPRLNELPSKRRAVQFVKEVSHKRPEVTFLVRRDALQDHTDHLAGPGLLSKRHNPKTHRTRTRGTRKLELYSKILTKSFSRLQLAHFCEFRHDGDVTKMTTIVFSVRDLRLSVVAGNGDIHIGLVFLGAYITFDTPLNDSGIPRLHAH